jgi:GNAT superfamily N-acetyltransferase
MRVRLALDGDEIVGGITYERYPHSRVGLVTYMVVAPGARERGLGRELLTDAVTELYAEGARLVVGEVNDPRVHGEAARPRLERFLRWGAQRIDIEYVQPSLGPGLSPDTGLCLIALPPVRPFTLDVVETFLHEFRAALG